MNELILASFFHHELTITNGSPTTTGHRPPASSFTSWVKAGTSTGLATWRLLADRQLIPEKPAKNLWVTRPSDVKLRFFTINNFWLNCRVSKHGDLSPLTSVNGSTVVFTGISWWYYHPLVLTIDQLGFASQVGWLSHLVVLKYQLGHLIW